MPNETIVQFVNMIQSQIIDYSNFGFQSPTVIVNFWLEIILQNLTSDWYKNLNATYIMDCVLSIAYQFMESWKSAKVVFKNYYPKLSDIKQIKSNGFSLFGGGSNPLETITFSPNHCWLALLGFEIEHEIYEIESSIWPELVNSMALTPHKSALDETLKSIAIRFGLSSLPSSSLVIFKLVNYILSISRDHPLVPIFIEFFNFLYLSRVYTSDTLTRFDVFGISSKLYTGNLNLMKKFKKWLQETENYYTSLALQKNQEQSEIIRSIHQKNAA